MAFWWVFQNSTYVEESKGSFLWAPKVGKNGNIPFHWENMTKLKIGDIIFSSYKQKIVAVSSVLSETYDKLKPFTDVNAEKLWESDGYQVDLNFHELKNPISINDIPEYIKNKLKVKYGPLNSNGTGNQGYLYSISDSAGRSLLDYIERLNNVDVEIYFLYDINNTKVESTTKQALIQSRLGQGDFRKELLKFWNGKCVISQLDLKEILIASHIKPWKYANDVERLDVYNGLILSPIYDTLFDKGFITFDNTGKILISNCITNEQKNIMNLTGNEKIHNLNIKHIKYLEFHQENIFRQC